MRHHPLQMVNLDLDVKYPLARSGVMSLNIEDLKIIQSDLTRTATDLEGVSLNLAGHLRYLQHTVNSQDAADVTLQIEKLLETVVDLRDVAQRLDC